MPLERGWWGAQSASQDGLYDFTTGSADYAAGQVAALTTCALLLVSPVTTGIAWHCQALDVKHKHSRYHLEILHPSVSRELRSCEALVRSCGLPLPPVCCHCSSLLCPVWWRSGAPGPGAARCAWRWHWRWPPGKVVTSFGKRQDDVAGGSASDKLGSMAWFILRNGMRKISEL